MEKHIVYSSSDAYAACTGVSILSLLKNSKKTENLIMHIITTDMTEQNRYKIRKITDEYHVKLEFVDVAQKLTEYAKNVGLELFRGSYNVYASLILHEIFEDVDRILLIDSDTLVVDDLEDLWHLNMEDKLLAAVPEIGLYGKISSSESYDVLYKNEIYYNAGIIFYNLENWRKENISIYLKEKMKEYGKQFSVVDQSIINYSLYEKIERLHLRYNYYTAVHGITYKTLVKNFYRKKIFLENEFTEAQKRPAIIHFIGQPFERPWYEKSASPYKDVYLNYWNMSPWAEKGLMKNPASKSFVFFLYDNVSYWMRKVNAYNLYHTYRYVFGQKIKQRLKQSR